MVDELVPSVKANLVTTGTEQNWLIGFSKYRAHDRDADVHGARLGHRMVPLALARSTRTASASAASPGRGDSRLCAHEDVLDGEKRSKDRDVEVGA